MRDSLLEDANISDSVDNLCTFQCPKCEKVCESRYGFLKHLKQSKHALSSKQIDSCLKDVIAHKCHICSRKVLCDKGTIVQHLSSHHNVTLKKYCHKMNLEHTTQMSKKKMEIVKLCSEISSKHEIRKKLGNFCKFSCLNCDYICNCFRLIKEHIRKLEHGPLLSYTKYVTNAIFHKCHVCGELILNDNEIFYGHIMNQHKLTMPQYRKRVALPNFEEQRNQYISKLKAEIKDIPVVQPKTNRVSQPNTLQEDQVTKNVGNLSFFKCPICPKYGLHFQTLVSHCKKEHQAKQLLYNKEHVEEARYHRCFICARIVLCDLSILTSHVRRSHGIAISLYIKNFVLKGGGKVFPTFRDYIHNNQSFQIRME